MAVLQHRAMYGFLAVLAITTLSLANGQASQFMEPQNAARSRLRLKPLVWDARLAKYAKWWANRRRGDCAMVHSNGPYGENIFWGSGSKWTPKQAATWWLSETRFYNYYGNACLGGKMCGHYLQIVWRETRRIGCARVVCNRGRGVIMTCNYDPPGNFLGERPF